MLLPVLASVACLHADWPRESMWQRTRYFSKTFLNEYYRNSLWYSFLIVTLHSNDPLSFMVQDQSVVYMEYSFTLIWELTSLLLFFRVCLFVFLFCFFVCVLFSLFVLWSAVVSVVIIICCITWNALLHFANKCYKWLPNTCNRLEIFFRRV